MNASIYRYIFVYLCYICIWNVIVCKKLVDGECGYEFPGFAAEVYEKFKHFPLAGEVEIYIVQDVLKNIQH